jgi:hypothetical protein
MMNRITLPIAACTIFSFVATSCLSLHRSEGVMAQSQEELQEKMCAKTRLLPASQAKAIVDLQKEVKDKDKSLKDVDSAMKDKFQFPKSCFPYYEPVDGCSAPDSWKLKKWNGVFESACNKHDICYTTPGNTKELCDHQMLRNMLEICTHTSDFPSQKERKDCESSAEGYYDGLDMNPLLRVSHAYNTAQDQERKYIKSVYDWLNSDLTGKWEAQASNNRWQMQVTWNSRENRYEGVLTKQGQLSQYVGFSINELVWTATMVDKDKMTVQQEYRAGSNGVSTRSQWVSGVINLKQNPAPSEYALNALVRDSSVFRLQDQYPDWGWIFGSPGVSK